jgi:NADH-quinone oxidoreductase subunit E
LKNIHEIVDGMSVGGLPLLQLLLAVQDATPQNYINETAVNEIAMLLKIPRSRVYSTASFYSEISLKPRGLHIIRVCTNAPCENAGKERVLNEIEQELKITVGQTTNDGLFSLESVNCLGACYMSPAIKIDDKIYGNLEKNRVTSILRNLREEVINE